jgi:hypothetical protein
MANNNGHGNRNGTANGPTQVRITFRRLDIAEAEFDALVKLAQKMEPREGLPSVSKYNTTQVPTSMNHGTLVFYHSTRKGAIDFYHDALPDFHFYDGELSPV